VADELTTMLTEFTKCLCRISFTRAGWDYHGSMSPEQKADERADELAALARARAIWAENPAAQIELRAAFKAYQPLATIDEIERTA
jgi:hypothetical protein